MQNKNPYPTSKDFLAAIKPYAQAIEAKYGIPWLMVATQAAHESRDGNSTLTREANNLFGVTGESWQRTGKPVYVIETKEFSAGDTQAHLVTRPFRKYASWAESLQDWVGLVMRVYPHAYTAATQHDPQGFFDGLKAGGYATDPQYAELLKIRYSELEGIA